MEYSPFIVLDEPYCLWGVDLKGRNRRFIEGFDVNYFEFIAETFYSAFEKEEEKETKKRAALALRNAYHHGLETLFSLICGTLQAPYCILGWIQKCYPWQVRKMVSLINEKEEFYNFLLLKKISWEEIVNTFFPIQSEDEEKIKKLFVDLWKHFAHEYIEEISQHEYNSIKHGFRARSGGFFLSIGQEATPGVPCPPENMKMMGGCDYGSSFFQLEKIHEDKHNFHIQEHSVNWDPESTAHSLTLIAISISNIISFLKIRNGISKEQANFTCPTDLEYFNKPWENKGIGITKISMNLNVDIEKKTLLSRDKIKDVLQDLLKKN